MNNYEFIKSLSKEDIALFLTAFCANHSYHGMKVTDFKQHLLKSVGYLLKERGEKNIARPIMAYEFLSQEYEGKEVYEHICDMTIEEMSGMFGLLSVSDRARLDVIYGDIPNYVLSGKRRPCEDMMDWLNREENSMKQDIRDCLMVCYDSRGGKLSGISAMRKTDKGAEMVNMVLGEKAEKLYNYLTGKAEIE